MQTNPVSDKILLRVYILFACFNVFALAIIGQVLYLQLYQRDKWEAVQNRDFVYLKRVPADRGSILADDGSVLAASLPFYRVGMDVTSVRPKDIPAFADSLDLLCNRLARHFGHWEDETFDAQYFKAKILKASQQKDRHIYLLPPSRLLTYSEMKLLRSFPILNRGRFKGGLVLEKVNNKRFYPFKDLARITLGLMKDDSIPVKGLENAYNAALRGKDGLMLVQRIPGNVEVPLNEYGEVEARDGYDIETTLNVHMQDVVANALEKAVEKSEAKGGVAIVMEVNTGHIKAIANYPEDFNYAVVTQYEPGSTFKLASVIAALEEGIVTPTDTIDTRNGEITYYDRKMRDVFPYRRLTFQQCFEKSSNVGISRVIAQGFAGKSRRFYEHLDRMGVLNTTDIHLSGEPQPYIIRPGNKHWAGTTLPWLSIGYNVRLTPLQQLAFFNAVANNGTFIQPVLVKGVKNNSVSVQEVQGRVLREKICSDKTLRIVQNMLRGVVEHGTASNIKGAHFAMAGKTGTCQKLVGKKYEKLYRATFAGYFPADQPRYSCFIMIDEPKGTEYYGAQLAAPVFKEIAENLHATDLQLLETRQVTAKAKPEYPVTAALNIEDAKTVYNALDISTPQRPVTDYVRARQADHTVVLSPVRLSKFYVPDVVGMSAKDALPLLENLGLRVRLQGTGKVRRQSIVPGTAIKGRQNIILELD
jgi:cell division protein FtsI (penicillin-binding protein 3)